MNMIRYALAALAAATMALPVAARAADVVGEEPPAPSVPYEEPASNGWAGPYVGATVGYGFGHGDSSVTGPATRRGFTGNGFAGVQGQNGQFVYGGEADVGYDAGTANAGTTHIKGGVDGSLRARLGYAVQDNMLLYVTGGLALGNVRLSDALAPASQSRTLAGWTVGAGGEYKFTQNWSGLIEYRYTDLGRATYGNIAGAPRVGFTSHTLRTGVNYRF